MSRKAQFFTFAAVVLLALIVGIFFSRPSGTKKTVAVGVLLPTSGGAASLGVACRNGVVLAVDEYNSSRSASEPELDLHIEDTQALPAVGISAFHKVTAVHQARVVIGPLASGVTLAVAPLANRKEVVVLSPGSSAPSITTAGEYVFRNELSEAYGARIQAELAYNLLNYRNMAMVYVNNEYGSGTANEFETRFSQLGGRITLRQAFNPGTTDFRTILTSASASAPDAIFFVFQDDISAFLRQRRELDVGIPVYTTPVFEAQANLEALRPLAEGVTYAYYGTFSPDAMEGAGSDFNKKYSVRYGSKPTYFAALGYDAARIVVQALRMAEFEIDDLRSSMYRIQDFYGVTGTTSFDLNGDVRKPVLLKSVKAGQIVRVK